MSSDLVFCLIVSIVAMFIGMCAGGWYLFDHLTKLRRTIAIVRNRARLLETQVLSIEDVFKNAASGEGNSAEAYTKICEAYNLDCRNKELQRIANYNRLQSMQSHFAEKRTDSSVDWDIFI